MILQGSSFNIFKKPPPFEPSVRRAAAPRGKRLACTPQKTTATPPQQICCSALQKSMAHWGLKLAVGAWWSCQPSFCWSLPARPASPAHLFDSSGRRRQSLILAYERLIEEFYTAMRGLYLLLLFLPVMLTAPVCVGMGWRRPAWVKVQAPPPHPATAAIGCVSCCCPAA